MATLTHGAAVRSRQMSVPVRSARVAERARRVRLSQVHVEGILLLLTVASLIVLTGSALGRFLVSPTTQPSTRIVVQRGDSLWKLASRHGDPNEYVLQRVDAIARRNNIKPGESLQPGDVLFVPVSLPAQGERVAAR